MPKRKVGFLGLNSMTYEGEHQNNSCVSKKLFGFMVKGTPFNGKALHTIIDPEFWTTS